MPFSTIFTALFYPYIAHERTAENLILSVRSMRFALCLKERHRSQNEGSLKSEERKSDVPSSDKNMYKSCIFMPFSTIFTALFYPYIAHERTAQNLLFCQFARRSLSY